jgi:8-oxo-dGTP pyrophosphatase MutT (NUDIX family)
VFPLEGHAHIVLTLRAHTLDRHSGQISLPGGVIEPGEAYEHAALREAHEEIAVAASEVRILGALTPIDIPVSGFRLHPIVGVSDARPAFAPADGEVARIGWPAWRSGARPRWCWPNFSSCSAGPEPRRDARGALSTRLNFRIGQRSRARLAKLALIGQ